MLNLADVFISFGDPAVSGVTNQLSALAKIAVRQVSIDSRQVRRGDLFVALPGEKVDGHLYVGHSFGRGAIAALTHQDVSLEVIPNAVVVDMRPGLFGGCLSEFTYHEGTPLIIRVENTLTALQCLAAYWRSKFTKLKCIGITGSVGKTTTKELIAQVLGTRFNVLKNEGNQNNEIGVPLTLLNLRPEHEVAVIEMGMYQRGEIALFASLAQPQIGVVTMVAPVHLERLGTIENIAAAKAELVEAIPENGIVVLNDDDDRVRNMASLTHARVITYGLTPRADVWADDIASFGLDGISFKLHQGDEVFPMRVPLLGRHSVHTALRAAVVSRVEGLGWEQILEGFLLPVPQLRLTVAGGPHQSLVLDDTYNASEESTIAALNLLSEINDGPHIAVLGDMFELGDAEESAHRNVGCRAGLVARDVVAVGERAKWIAEEATACSSNKANVYHVSDNVAAIALLKDIIKEKSVILVKGSRGMRMEEVVSGLAEMAEQV